VLLIYRPPCSKNNKQGKELFLEEFGTILEDLITYRGHLLILGDFNFHWECVSDTGTKLLAGLLDSMGLIQHVAESTHVSGHTLDLVMSRRDDNLLLAASVGSLMTDHHLINIEVNIPKPTFERTVLHFRKFKSINLDTFRSDVLNSELHQKCEDSLHGMVSQYNTVLRSIIDSHAPLKSRVLTLRPRAPWCTEDVQREKRKRRQLERQWRRSKLEVHRQMFQCQRNKVSELLRTEKAKHFTQEIEECGTDQKALYKLLNKLLNRERKQCLPSSDSQLNLANEFNAYFVAKINKIREKLEQLDANECPIDTESCPHVWSSFSPVNPDNLIKLIKSSPKKSCALDPLPTWLLHQCQDELIPVLCKIINLSLDLGEFPEDLKTAHITPLLKKANLDPENMKNYRPVSNLSFLSKTLERVVSQELCHYLDNNGLREPLQSGYRSGHSVETALLRVQNDLLRAVDEGQGAILILLDLSAAFDTVDHTKLLSRLDKRIGVRGTVGKWFHSYLTGRTQAVAITSQLSERVDLACGVPQGSVLGPQLFTIYTSPIGDICRKHGIQVHLYADDTQLYQHFSVDSPVHCGDVVHNLEACVCDLHQWMVANMLKLNGDKTELLVVQNPRLPKVILPQFKIENCPVIPTSSVRNLGVIFDQAMTMESQVNNICRSCYLHLHNIGRIRDFITSDAAAKLVHALISSKLDSNNSLLYGLPARIVRKLQHVQNTAARIVTRTKKYQHITPVLEDLHWLPVHHRVTFKIALLTFKSLSGQAPVYIRELIDIYKPGRASLRSASELRLKKPRTRLMSYGARGFYAAAPVVWNSLPVHIRTTDVTTEIFKASLKTHLFELAFKQ
jgi:hypothetical protein